jgi:K+/H+ antiporter YhaU regulatory subunit KhtT
MALPQPSNVIEFKLPKRRPKVVEKPAPPEQKKFAVIPFKAILDERLTNGDIRCLALLAAYCNRAGVTWVSQNTLAERLKVSRQQISRHMAHLRECGHVRITHKGFRGERCNTLQVVFDESVSIEDAVAITSAQEDTRPPEFKERDQKAMEDQDLPNLTPEQIEANKRRLASLLATMATQKTGINHQEHTMPKQETETVKAIKKRIAEKRPKATPRVTKTTNQPVDNSVDNLVKPVDNSLSIGNIIGNLEVAQKTKKITIEGLYKVIDLKKTSLGYLLGNLSETDVRWLEHLVNVGTTEDEFTQAIESTQRKTVAEVARDLLAAKGLA